MRTALSDALVATAERDPRFVVLTGDHGYALFDAFRARFADRYINAGVAEQGMVGIAAGMAMAGYHPAVYGLSAFIPVRVLEQIKLDVCYANLPVIFIGDGAGVVYSTLGSSHQSAEDIAAVRALPNLTILSPADRFEMRSTFELATTIPSPVYLRVGKADRGDVHTGPIKTPLGEPVPVVDADEPDTVVFATGSMVITAMQLARERRGVRVFSVPSLKPLREDLVAELVADVDSVITMEEHNEMGGLGSIIAEILGARAPRRLLRIGVPDAFSTRAGSHGYLMRMHGLDFATVCDRVDAFRTAKLDSLIASGN